MEGNGPTRGRPRQIGALLASKSPYALDLTCARIMGLGVEDVPTLAAAHQRGLAPARAEDLAVAGDLAAVSVSDFDNILSHRGLDFSGSGKLDRLVGGVISAALASKPAVKPDQCIGCALCANTCPAHAIQMRNKLPKIHRKLCIRCFCCQEFCPKGAMVVRRPAIARMLNPNRGERGAKGEPHP